MSLIAEEQRKGGSTKELALLMRGHGEGPRISRSVVLAAIKRLGPSSYEDVAKELDLDAGQTARWVRKLERTGLVKTFRISAGGSSCKAYGFNELFDSVILNPHEKLVVLAHNDEHLRELGEKIMSAIKVDGLTHGKRTAITHHLKSADLPEKIVERVRRELKSISSTAVKTEPS